MINCPERMADGNRAAVDVELGFVDAELARAGHHLGAERLVDLEAIDVGKFMAGALEHRFDGGNRADAHDLRRHAHSGAGDDARERKLAGSLCVIAGGDQRRRRAVDDRRGIAAGLHAAKRGWNFRQHLDWRWADMGVGAKLLPALELERARLKAFPFEGLALHRRDLAGEKARLLGGERALEAARGIGIDLRPRDLILARQILGGVAHARVGRRIAQRFPQKILEVDRAHAKPAHRVGSDRIAAHGFRPDTERKPDILVGNEIGGLHQHLEAGAADPLHHVRGHLDRHAGIKPDVARQAVGVEARLRHRAGDDGAHVLRRQARALEHLARRLDAEIRRRHRGQWAVVVGKRRAHAA